MGEAARSKSVTAADVAAAVGVSRSTVSRAFTPSAYVKPDLRERILLTADTLGYRPDVLARALQSQDVPIIGLLLHDFANPFHAELYGALTKALQRVGLTPLTAQLNEAGGVETALSVFQQYRVRRVVLTSFAITPDVLSACVDAGLEVFLLNRADEAGRLPSIVADLQQGGRLAAHHVAQSGRSRVAILDGVTGSWTAESRTAGYLEGLNAYGIAPNLRLPGDYTYASGLAAADWLLSGGALPDAVLCANDLSAFGLMDGLRAAGVSAPDDVALVGFDDVPMADWGAYALTSVRLPVQAMVDALVDQLKGAASEPPQWALPCDLVVRATA